MPGSFGNEGASRIGKDSMLKDNYNRVFKYLRLSITEKCNFKCSYCLPNGYSGGEGSQFLTADEIQNLAFGFKDFGIEKIRLTGGEPTLRRDLNQIISNLKHSVGVEEVALTTNGFRLEHIASDLKKSGLDSINISLDSLRVESFKKITASEKGAPILRSIDTCLDLGFKKTKVNTVFLKDLNSDEFFDFLEFVKDRPISLRFIELMRTGWNKSYFKNHYSPLEKEISVLESLGWKKDLRKKTSGPAQEYSHPNYLGKIGFISPYSKDFCVSCNRLRVTSRGHLRLCLFGDGSSDLRPYLQSRDMKDELEAKVCGLLGLKPEKHRLHNNNYGDMNSLSMIGG